MGQHGLVAQPLHGELVERLGMGQVGGHLERGGLIAGNRLVRMAADGRRLLLGVYCRKQGFIKGLFAISACLARAHGRRLVQRDGQRFACVWRRPGACDLRG